MKKKVARVLFAFVLILAMIPLTASADHRVTTSGIRYSIKTSHTSKTGKNIFHGQTIPAQQKMTERSEAVVMASDTTSHSRIMIHLPEI